MAGVARLQSNLSTPPKAGTLSGFQDGPDRALDVQSSADQAGAICADLGMEMDGFIRLMQEARARARGFPVDCQAGAAGERDALCAVLCNAVVVVVDGKPSATGVYGPCFSFQNHSCRPNAVYDFDRRGRVRVQTLQALAPGDEVVIAYLDTAHPLAEVCVPLCADL